MDPKITSITRKLEEAWQAYVASALRAQRTHKLEDGLAARRAWALFIRLDDPHKQ